MDITTPRPASRTAQLSTERPTLLVPLDLHGCADAVVDRAIWLGRMMNARLVLLTVMPPAPPDSDVHGSSIVVGDRAVFVEAHLEDACRKILEGLTARIIDAGLPPPRVLARHGRPAHVIVAVAAEERPSLVVMGTHARSGVKRAVFGSVAEAVLRASPCPVLIDPAGRGIPDAASDELLQADAETMG